MNHLQTLADLKARTDFAPLGDPVGNLTLGRGRWRGAPVHIAIIENRIASGSLGVKECEKLASLFRIVATQKTPLVMFIDSAGARVSEGLPALGAFRLMYRAALDMALSGAPFTALLGANCYGGASMLAALARERVFSDNTQLAMSGPSILAQAAGTSALDEMFRAIAEAAIGANARAKLASNNAREWSGAALAADETAIGTAYVAHQVLAARLATGGKRLGDEQATPVSRNDFAALFADGYEAREHSGEGVVFGLAGGSEIALLGLVDRKPLTAARAWLFADRVWVLANAKSPPKRLVIVVDCEAHATAIDDEKVMLSSFIADLAVALAALAKRGTFIETTVLGILGGGVYVALAAASANINLLHGAHIQLLPGRAIASILGGDGEASKYEVADYQKAQVAENELRVGFLRE